jgi:hypothetical protein
MAETGVTGAKVIGVIGIVLYAATCALYLSSGLMVPFPWLLGLWAVWLAGIAVLVWVFRSRPVLTPLLAVGAVVLWFAILSLGEQYLGWTA